DAGDVAGAVIKCESECVQRLMEPIERRQRGRVAGSVVCQKDKPALGGTLDGKSWKWTFALRHMERQFRRFQGQDVSRDVGADDAEANRRSLAKRALPGGLVAC